MLYFIHERTSSHEAHATQLLLSIPIALENCSENLMRALFNPMNRKTFSFPPQTRRKKSFTFLHREGCCCCSFYFVTEKKSINSYHSFSPIHTSLNNKQYFLTINHFEGDEICVILLCKVYERYQWREKKTFFTPYILLLHSDLCQLRQNKPNGRSQKIPIRSVSISSEWIAGWRFFSVTVNLDKHWVFDYQQSIKSPF